MEFTVVPETLTPNFHFSYGLWILDTFGSSTVSKFYLQTYLLERLQSSSKKICSRVDILLNILKTSMLDDIVKDDSVFEWLWKQTFGFAKGGWAGNTDFIKKKTLPVVSFNLVLHLFGESNICIHCPLVVIVDRRMLTKYLFVHFLTFSTVS